MATSFQPFSQRTASNGTTAVDICAAPATGKTRIVVSIRYTNRDTVDHTAMLVKDINGTAREIKRVAAVPALTGCEEEWCSVNRPIHLLPTEKLQGDQLEVTSTTEGEWLVEGHEGTD
jgi:hypothetical protein